MSRLIVRIAAEALRCPERLCAPLELLANRKYCSNARTNVIKSPYGGVEDVPLSLPDFVFQDFEKKADKAAITCGVSGRSYNYGTVHALMRQFAQALIAKLKLTPGDTIGLILPNIPEYPIVIYGAMLAGLKVSIANPLYSADELTRQFLNCDAKCIVSIEPLLEKMKEVNKNLMNSHGLIMIGESMKIGDGIYSLKSLLSEKYNVGLPKINPNNVTLIPYSSGTTGLPKGVQLTHNNLTVNIKQITHEINLKHSDYSAHHDTILTVPPFFHIYGLNGILNYNFRIGQHLVSIPRFVPDDYLNCLIKYRPTSIFVVPSLLSFLASHPNVSEEHLASVEIITVGAAPITESVFYNFLRKCKKSEDQIVIQQGYGMTESSPALLLTPYTKDKTKLLATGQLLPGTEARIVSLTTGEDLGPNRPGELLVRGPQIMKGYLNNEAATKETIDEDRWLHTGDVAYYDEDFYFYIVDRTKELIKVKGNQVSPSELENLIQELPEVADAAVAGVPDGIAGELPRAFVVAKPGSSITEDRIYAWVADKVVKYKRLDGGVVFVDSIPRNPGGKIMRNELKAQARQKQAMQ